MNSKKKGVISVSRLKTAVARFRRIERKKEFRRGDRASLRWADDVGRCVASHASKGHGLRLRVDDDGQVLECMSCEIPVLMGSDDVMETIMGQMKACGIEFDVLCEPEMVE